MLLTDHNPYEDEIEGYDDFFGDKAKRAERRAARKARRAARRMKPKRIARRAKRKRFFSQLGQAYKDLGGGAAIGGAIDTIINPTASQNLLTPQSVANSSMRTDDIHTDQDKKDSKDNTTTIVLYAVLGVVVVGSIGAMVYHSQKDKYIHVQKG